MSVGSSIAKAPPKARNVPGATIGIGPKRLDAGEGGSMSSAIVEDPVGTGGLASDFTFPEAA
jgi:hypothetical protein